MPTDVELLIAWRGGDRLAGNELFNRYFVAIHRFFQRKVDDEVEDLVQRTFVACVENKDRFRGDASFRTFLFAIANNVLCRHYRTKARKGVAIDFEDISAADLGAGLSTILNAREQVRVLVDGLRSIPIAFQVILELVYWEQMTGPELAEVLEVPVDTARSRLRKARQLLEKAVTERPRAPDELAGTLEDLERWVGDLHAHYERALA